MIRLLLPLFCLSLLSCAAHGKLQRVVAQEDDLWVTLDGRTISASPPIVASYSHPASISPELIEKALGSVSVRQSPGLLMALFARGEVIHPLFDPQSLPVLSSKLSLALAQAGPLERVDFYQILPRNRVLVSVTSGILFIKDQRLYLQINHFKAPLNQGERPTVLDGRSATAEMEQAEAQFNLIAGPHGVLRSYRNWIGTGSDPHIVVIDYLALNPSESAGRSAAAPSPLPASPKSPGAPPAEGTLEEKLRALQHLRDEGLITEEEYSEKKRSLLKDF